MLLAVAAVLVLTVLGALMWRSHRNHIRTASVSANVSKTPDLTQGNPVQDTSVMSSIMSTDPNSKLPVDKQAKPKDQNATATPGSPTAPAKSDNAVLQPPLTIAKNAAKPVEASPDSATPAPVLGGLPNKGPSSVISSIPVSQPQLAAKVQVSSGVAQGLLVHQVTPRYPAQARQAHVQGTVVLQALIGKDGSVRNLHALSGPPMLTQAAVDAVKQWRYKPYYLDGQPVEAETQINVKFTP